MSPIQVTCRRTIGLARNLYSTAFMVAGFLAVAAAMFAFNLQSAEGGRLALPAIWAVSVSPVLPVLAAFLAMGVWSDERQAGRIEMLLTTAVRERDLVFGKFLGVLALMSVAVVFFQAVSLFALSFFAPAALRGVQAFSFLPALLALLIQGILWCAVSVAASALTERGAMAACMSIGVLVALPRALWAGFKVWAPMGRSAFGEMPLDAHVVDIASGVFSTGTIFSYLVLAGVMLFITSKCIVSIRLVGKGARPMRISTFVTILLSVAFAVLSILLLLRLDRIVDVPVGRTVLRFSPRMRSVLTEASGDIAVTSFLSRSDSRFRPLGHFLRALKHEADAMGGVRLDIRFVDPRWDLGAAERLIRQGAQEGSLVFEKSRRVAVVPLGDGYNESICASAIRRVALPPQRRNVYWTFGHGECSFEDYGAFGLSDIARELAREGYVNARIDLAGEAQIPQDCAVIVVAGAKSDFSRVELGRLDAYLKNGGRLLALLTSEQGGVASLLPSWGLRVQFQPLVGSRTLSGSDVIVSEFTGHAVSAPLTGSQIVLERPFSFVPSAATEGAAGADRLEYSSVAKVGQVTVSAAVERGAGAGRDLAIRPTRIVTVGDASFVMNGQLAARANANRDFFVNCIAHLSGTDAAAAGDAETAVLTAGIDRETRVRFVVVLAGAVPAVVMFAMLVMVFVRRRRG